MGRNICIGCIVYTFDSDDNITSIIVDYRMRDETHKKLEMTVDRYLEIKEIRDIIKILDNKPRGSCFHG